MKRIIGLFVLSIAAMFVLINCGGEGVEDAPQVTPPSQSLQGTYFLIGFDVDYSDGTTINENSPIITSWSGIMKIGTTSWYQSFEINNIPYSVSGSATISWITPGVSGIAHVTDSSGTHDVSFTISGNDLTTYSGVVESGPPGLTFKEWDHWTKLFDSIAPVRESSITENTDEPESQGKHWIGELLTQ